jgi:hypothetical protein
MEMQRELIDALFIKKESIKRLFKKVDWAILGKKMFFHI